MTKSEPIIDFDMRERTVKNYAPFLSDRPYPRFGKLCEAPMIALGTAAGCIASTPGDMGLYLRMIANRGRGPKANLISSQGFELFSKPHIKAEDFGPTASYGYGIAVDQLEGNTILRHTGGMVSFMSSMMVNLDEGVAPLLRSMPSRATGRAQWLSTQFELMRANRQHKALPPAPQTDLPTRVENASDYQGLFTSSDGRKLAFASEVIRCSCFMKASAWRSRRRGRLIVSWHRIQRSAALRWSLAASSRCKAARCGRRSQLGGDWYTNGSYTGPKQFDYPKEWDSYVGHYRNESPWISSTRVVIVKGKLTLDGSRRSRPTASSSACAANLATPSTFGSARRERQMHAPEVLREDLWRTPAA